MEGTELMVSNYPPGVTGGEFAIAGPDFEVESETPCPFLLQWDEDGEPIECGESTMEQGYRGERWLTCDADAKHHTELDPDEGAF